MVCAGALCHQDCFHAAIASHLDEERAEPILPANPTDGWLTATFGKSMEIPQKLVAVLSAIARCLIAVICAYGVIESLCGPSGFSDKSHYFIAPFGVVAIISIFMRRLGVIRVHLIWLFVLLVVVQQAYRRIDYETGRADHNQRTAIELEVELQKKK